MKLKVQYEGMKEQSSQPAEKVVTISGLMVGNALHDEFSSESEALVSDKIDLFVPGWTKNPDWNSVIGWCSFNQPENKLLSRSFWRFKSAYSISLSQFANFINTFRDSPVFLTQSISWLKLYDW